MRTLFRGENAHTKELLRFEEEKMKRKKELIRKRTQPFSYPGFLRGEGGGKVEYLLCFCLLFLSGFSIRAQDRKDTLVQQIFLEAMKPMLEGRNFALRFEIIAWDLDKPLDLFSAPEYKKYRGAYLYVDGSKMEMKFPEVKAISDGILYLITYEENRIILVDSVREGTGQNPEAGIAMTDFIKNNIDSGSIELVGEEMVAGENCYKLRIAMNMQLPKEEKIHTEVLYWISKDKRKLIMLAEKRKDKYKSYLVKSLGKAPAGYDYGFFFPKERKTELMGYRVMDGRFR